MPQGSCNQFVRNHPCSYSDHNQRSGPAGRIIHEARCEAFRIFSEAKDWFTKNVLCLNESKA